MKQNVLNWMIMTTLMLLLGWSVTSCKDDDDAGKTAANAEVGGDSSVEMTLSDDERVLASLVKHWCDVEPADLKGGIINQTFEPSIGYAEGNVRTMVMETEEAADAYAAAALGILNINPQQPAGFSWQGALGSVGYRRGTGNELGVIDVSIRQLPHLEKIRLVRDAEENAPKGTPYYRKGDVVKYTGSGHLNGRYFLCLQEHGVGQPAYWINIEQSHETPKFGTCSWMMTGKDTVCNDEMASFTALSIWLKDFVFDEVQWQEVITHTENLQERPYLELVPMNNRDRAALVRSIIRTPDEVVTDAWMPVSKTNDTIQAVKAGWARRTLKVKSDYVIEQFCPVNLLLCNTMRWSMGTTYHYWVPNISLVERRNGLSDSDILSKRLNETASQVTLSPDHFEWSAFLDYHIDISGVADPIVGDYDLYMTAVHWTHDPYTVANDTKKHYALLDFTKRIANDEDADVPTLTRNVSSHELVVTDNGERYKYFEDVYCRQAQAANVVNEPFCMGDVLQDDADGSRWFCVRPSASVQSQLNHALFVSFDGIETYDGRDASASNILSKEEAEQFAMFFSSMYLNLTLDKNDAKQLTALNCVKQNAGVDIKKLVAARDSIVVLNYSNTTKSFNFSLAYNDGTRDRQPLMRIMFDGSHALQGDRSATGDEAYFYIRYYNHYQLWDGTKNWTADWTMSNQAMFLDDVTSQETVDRYATDKWVVLPYETETDRHTKRTSTDAQGGKVSRYLWKNGNFADPTARNLYNEPVLFLRSMWLADKTLTANGHTFTVLDHLPYRTYSDVAALWYQRFTQVASKFTTVDNELRVPFKLTK